MELIVTKNGRVEFAPIRVKKITLRSVSLYLNMYNLATETVYTTSNGGETKLPPGWYTYDDIMDKLGSYLWQSSGIDVEENTYKVSYDGTLKGGLADRIKNDHLYLTPLYLKLSVDSLNSFKNLIDGEQSHILDVIPLAKVDFGEIIHYESKVTKPLREGEINSINVDIKDDLGNDFMGEFIAQFYLE